MDELLDIIKEIHDILNNLNINKEKIHQHNTNVENNKSNDKNTVEDDDDEFNKNTIS